MVVIGRYSEVNPLISFTENTVEKGIYRLWVIIRVKTRIIGWAKIGEIALKIAHWAWLTVYTPPGGGDLRTSDGCCISEAG